MSKRGTFCISVDQHDVEGPLVQQRRQDIVHLLHEYQIPSSWSFSGEHEKAMPIPYELSLVIRKDMERAELIRFLRQSNATMLGQGKHIDSIVVDPHEIAKVWDIVVRQGCHVARPRTADACTGTSAQVVRGGLWYAPMSCSFVGGSRRTVQSLAKICQKRLVQAAYQGRLFHLNIELGRERKSWREELVAIRGLVQSSLQLQEKGLFRCVTLSEVGRSQSSAVPQMSVLRRAA